MNPSPYQTVVFPVALGDASNFNRVLFPLLSFRKRDSLGRGDLFLDATLDEMLRITKIGANPEQYQALIATTKARYDQLMLQKAELERHPKSKNPLKLLSRYRSIRMFVAASKSLYVATRSRSEEMARSVGRSLLSVPAEDLQPVNDDASPDANSKLEGIAVRLDRPLDDATTQQLLDTVNTIASYSVRFEDNQANSDTSTICSDEYFSASGSMASLVDSDTDTEETPDTVTPRPSSPTVINHINNYFFGSIYSPNSNICAPTMHLGGAQNNGSVLHNVTTAHTEPKAT